MATELRHDGKSWRVGLLTLLAIAALAGWPVWIHYREKPYEQLFQNAHAIQLALERYSVDNDANGYPTDLQQLFEQGYLKHWPDNPFGPGRMKLLTPEQPWEPGAFVYAAMAQTGSPKGQGRQYDWILPGKQPASAEPPMIYTVIFYAPRPNDELKKRREAWLKSEATRPASEGFKRPNEYTLPGVDWKHAAYMLTGSGFR